MKWTVSRRITAGFAISLGLVLLMAAIGAYALASSEKAYTAALEQEQTVLVRALEAQADFQTANLRYLFYLLDPEERWQRQNDSALTAANDKVAQVAAGVRLEAERDAWRAAAAILAQVREPMRASMEEARQGRQAEALRIRDSRVGPLRDDLYAAMDEGIRLGREVTTDIIRDAQASKERLEWLLLLGSLLAFAAGLATAILLNRVVTRPLQETSTVLATSAAEIVAATTQQASGASETAAAITETVTTIDEVTQTAEHATERARAVSELAQRAAEIGRAGRSAVDSSVAEMDQVRTQVESISRSIVTLAEQAQAIGEIIATVTDIAEQTNLLALNAAVEAARAGEQGRGFAVVASEIRGLADEAKKATVQVRQILGEIQRATAAAVTSSERGTKQVSDGAKQVADAGETIRELAAAIGEASQAAAQIVASASQQAAGMAQIRQAMASVQEATQQNLAATRQAEHAAQDLNALGAGLLELVGGTQVVPARRRV
jgi:methyl-accepting chemotaxis protein